MFFKLLKNDLKDSYIKYVIYALILIALSFVFYGFIRSNFEDEYLSTMFYQFSIAEIAGIVGFPVFVVVNQIIRYTKLMHKDEAYLTHTLPVKTETIFASKMFANIIFYSFAILVDIFCLFIIAGFKDSLEFIDTFLEALMDGISGKSFLLSLIDVAVNALYFLIAIPCAIAIGHSFTSNKGILSVVFYFVIETIVRFVSVIVSKIVVTNLKNPDYYDILKASSACEILIHIIFIVVCYFVGLHFLKKKLSLQ